MLIPLCIANSDRHWTDTHRAARHRTDRHWMDANGGHMLRSHSCIKLKKEQNKRSIEVTN